MKNISGSFFELWKEGSDELYFSAFRTPPTITTQLIDRGQSKDKRMASWNVYVFPNRDNTQIHWENNAFQFYCIFGGEEQSILPTRRCQISSCMEGRNIQRWFYHTSVPLLSAVHSLSLVTKWLGQMRQNMWRNKTRLDKVLCSLL